MDKLTIVQASLYRTLKRCGPQCIDSDSLKKAADALVSQGLARFVRGKLKGLNK